VRHHCLGCNTITYHWHLHDTAHGIPETHLAGSERFQCKECKRTTFAHSPDADLFTFVLDGRAQRTIAA
jgi:hypothetical protein